MTSSYWFAPRPKNSEHRHPFLVFDCSDRLHLPLTLFGKEASIRVSQKTVQIYLYTILADSRWPPLERLSSTNTASGRRLPDPKAAMQSPSSSGWLEICGDHRWYTEQPADLFGRVETVLPGDAPAWGLRFPQSLD